LPTVYSNRLFVTSGGLICYSPDRIEQFRRAAGYVDRILKGEKPADLPVQAPNTSGWLHAAHGRHAGRDQRDAL
jgi:ABC-type uncharacterized transport system substrate-binding protein